MKKFIAILLTVALVFALGISAYAAVDPDDYTSYVDYDATETDGTITIVPSESENLSGTSFVAYKVFDVTGTYEISGVTYYAYDLEDAFYAFFAGSDYLNSAVTGVAVTSEAARGWIRDHLTNAEALNDFGEAVIAYAGLYTATTPALISCTGTASAGSYVFLDSDLAGAGYYVIADTTAASEFYNPMVCAVVTNYNDVTITRKGTTPSIDKSITGAADSDSDGIPDYAETATGMIGATVPFQLTSKIPNMTGIDSYTFKFTDTLSGGLTYNEDLEVTIGGGAALTEGTDYTESFDSVTNVLTITFVTTNWATAYHVGDAIVASYTATVNKNAIAIDVENNTAKVTYTNHSGVDQDSVPSNVQVSELDFTITKQNEAEATLEGAIFALYTTRSGSVGSYTYGSPVSFSADSGVYYVDPSSTATDRTELESDGSGLIKINGLEAGVYYLVETEAPAGYNLLTDAVTITVKARLADLDLDGDEDDIEYYATGDDIENDSITITDSAGIILPSTGGIGTVMFRLGGIAIIFLAGVFLVVNRRKVFGSGK